MVHEETPRARRRAKTAARIVDTGLRLLTDGGFDALTMQRLADELDYVPGAVYRYFGSKDELLLAIQLRVVQRLEEDVARASAELDARGGTALAHLVLVTRTYATLGVRRPAEAALLSRWLGAPELLVDTDRARERAPELMALFEHVPRRFVAAAAEGQLAAGDPVRRGLAMFGAVQGIVQMRKLERLGLPGLSADALLEELLVGLFVGWGAERSSVADALDLTDGIIRGLGLDGPEGAS
ncbi:MAG: TetR/AcrR family transcriptional regulator [Sandaracinaceae bacterium]